MELCHSDQHPAAEDSICDEVFAKAGGNQRSTHAPLGPPYFAYGNSHMPSTPLLVVFGPLFERTLLLDLVSLNMIY